MRSVEQSSPYEKTISNGVNWRPGRVLLPPLNRQNLAILAFLPSDRDLTPADNGTYEISMQNIVDNNFVYVPFAYASMSVELVVE
jgi:hypothetical protein